MASESCSALGAFDCRVSVELILDLPVSPESLCMQMYMGCRGAWAISGVGGTCLMSTFHPALANASRRSAAQNWKHQQIVMTTNVFFLSLLFILTEVNLVIRALLLLNKTISQSESEYAGPKIQFRISPLFSPYNHIFFAAEFGLAGCISGVVVIQISAGDRKPDFNETFTLSLFIVQKTLL